MYLHSCCLLLISLYALSDFTEKDANDYLFKQNEKKKYIAKLSLQLK